MVKINGVKFEIIKHSQQRYDTCGDWDYVDGVLIIRVSELGDWRYELLVALHEFVEAVICNFNNISEAEVTQFDFQHLDEPEPGDLESAPYHKAHVTATMMEKFLSRFLKVDWESYENAIQKLDYLDAT